MVVARVLPAVVVVVLSVLGLAVSVTVEATRTVEPIPVAVAMAARQISTPVESLQSPVMPKGVNKVEVECLLAALPGRNVQRGVGEMPIDGPFIKRP